MKYLLKTVSVGPILNNCYLLTCAVTKKTVIIDPGMNAERVLNALASIEGATVAAIINTHGHFDHIMANSAVKKATGAQVLLHEADAEMLRHGYGHTFNKLYADSIDITLKGGEVLEVGELKIEVIHTPGHSPGGICLLCEDLLFSGDTLFRLEVGRCDLPGGDLELLIRGIKEKLLPLPDYVRVLPGHEDTSTIGEERAANPYLTG